MAARPSAVAFIPNGLNSPTWPQRCQYSPTRPASYTSTGRSSRRAYRAASSPTGPAPSTAIFGTIAFGIPSPSPGAPVEYLALAQGHHVAAVAPPVAGQV